MLLAPIGLIQNNMLHSASGFVAANKIQAVVFNAPITYDSAKLWRRMRPFIDFARRFTINFVLSAYTAFAVVSTCLTFVRLPAALHKSIPYVVAALLLMSVYRAAWVLYQQSESKVVSLQSQLVEQGAKFSSELEQARKRPYDEAQRNLIAEKIAKVTARERDLLRLLLSRGPTDSHVIQRLWIGEKHDTDQLLNVLKSAGLTTVKVEQTLNAARTNAIWEVNATSAVVLKDLLYPRREDDAKPYFEF